MKQIRFFMILSVVLFAGQAFGDNAGIGGYGSSGGIDGNAYNRSGSTNRTADRPHNNNSGSSVQSSHSPGYFPLGSDLRDKPVQHSDGNTSRREAN